MVVLLSPNKSLLNRVCGQASSFLSVILQPPAPWKTSFTPQRVGGVLAESRYKLRGRAGSELGLEPQQRPAEQRRRAAQKEASRHIPGNVWGKKSLFRDRRPKLVPTSQG